MRWFFFFINLILVFPCFCENSVAISVIIPCDSSHIQYLSKLLDALEIQTYKPDEVIISISNSKREDDLLITQKSNFSFALKILRSSKRQFAGENRNIAIANSTGDLIICQDADDVPHIQRIEIIKNLFQEKHFDFLLHFFSAPANEYIIDQYIEYYSTLKFPKNNHDFLSIDPSIDLFDLNNVFPNFFTEFFPDEITSVLGVHFGNCAFKRDVFDVIQYNSNPSGQDVNFFSNVIHKFNNNILINLPLVYYIRPRSTYYLGREN